MTEDLPKPKRTRLSAVTFWGFALTFAALIIALVALLFPRQDEFQPLGVYQNPAAVLNTVQGQPGAAVRPGDIIRLRRRRCNEETVATVSYRQIVSVDDQVPPLRVDLPVTNQIRQAGCETTVDEVPIPRTIPAGTYIMRVDETAVSNDRVQIKALVSEPFKVIVP